MKKLILLFIITLFFLINACVKDEDETTQKPKTVYQNESATLLNTGVNKCEHIIVLKGQSAGSTYFPINLGDSLKTNDYEDVIISFEIIEGNISCDYVDHPNYNFSTSSVEFENIMIKSIQIE